MFLQNMFSKHSQFSFLSNEFDLRLQTVQRLEFPQQKPASLLRSSEKGFCANILVDGGSPYREDIKAFDHPAHHHPAGHSPYERHSRSTLTAILSNISRRQEVRIHLRLVGFCLQENLISDWILVVTSMFEDIGCDINVFGYWF